VIELAGVTKIYRDPSGKEVVAVDNVDLQLAEGETVALIGTSGCGKTTTLKMVNRLIEPTRGTIRVDGADVSTWDVIRLRRSFGYVIQKGGLFPHLTVQRNVGLLCELEGWDKAKIAARTAELLDLVNLPAAKFGARFPRELSGGQRQRVGIARALALDPPCILMDEPFGALDPITRDQIHDEFLQLRQRVKKTVLFVTHDMAGAFKLADRVALMNAGKLIQIGSEVDFRERPATTFVADFLKSHLHAGGAHA